MYVLCVCVGGVFFGIPTPPPNPYPIPTPSHYPPTTFASRQVNLVLQAPVLVKAVFDYNGTDDALLMALRDIVVGNVRNTEQLRDAWFAAGDHNNEQCTSELLAYLVHATGVALPSVQTTYYKSNGCAAAASKEGPLSDWDRRRPLMEVCVAAASFTRRVYTRPSRQHHLLYTCSSLYIYPSFPFSYALLIHIYRCYRTQLVQQFGCAACKMIIHGASCAVGRKWTWWKRAPLLCRTIVPCS